MATDPTMVILFSNSQIVDSAYIDVVTVYPNNRIGIRMKGGKFIEIKESTDRDMSLLKLNHIPLSLRCRPFSLEPLYQQCR
jgi:hypothetical protein